VKNFHVSDVLTATTGRLVSSRHMDGVYDIYNFLTGDSLFTHQLPRAARECQPWLDAQFPNLTEQALKEQLADLDRRLAMVPRDRDRSAAVCDAWVEDVRVALGLPEQVAVYELGADMHTRIDPLEEARAMFGEDKVIAIDPVAGEVA
jgi:hypothetical protein